MKISRYFFVVAFIASFIGTTPQLIAMCSDTGEPNIATLEHDVQILINMEAPELIQKGRMLLQAHHNNIEACFPQSCCCCCTCCGCDQANEIRALQQKLAKLRRELENCLTQANVMHSRFHTTTIEVKTQLALSISRYEYLQKQINWMRCELTACCCCCWGMCFLLCCLLPGV